MPERTTSEKCHVSSVLCRPPQTIAGECRREYMDTRCQRKRVQDPHWCRQRDQKLSPTFVASLYQPRPQVRCARVTGEKSCGECRRNYIGLWRFPVRVRAAPSRVR